jgi:predicted double-glycine peptidase
MQQYRKRIVPFMALLILCQLSYANEDSKEMFKSEHPIIEGAEVMTPSTQIRVPVLSWKTLRNQRVVKQNLDYSCGAASLATLLNEFYGQSFSEKELLQALDKGDMRASFEDMQKALPQLGFRAQGYAASFDQLTKLKAPVIVYLKYRNNEHFSVLRGINEHTVWLADPSLGNRTYSKAQFLEMWNTRESTETPGLSGKFLAVFPTQSSIKFRDDIFYQNTRSPNSTYIGSNPIPVNLLSRFKSTQLVLRRTFYQLDIAPPPIGLALIVFCWR